MGKRKLIPGLKIRLFPFLLIIVLAGLLGRAEGFIKAAIGVRVGHSPTEDGYGKPVQWAGLYSKKPAAKVHFMTGVQNPHAAKALAAPESSTVVVGSHSHSHPVAISDRGTPGSNMLRHLKFLGFNLYMGGPKKQQQQPQHGEQHVVSGTEEMGRFHQGYQGPQSQFYEGQEYAPRGPPEGYGGGPPEESENEIDSDVQSVRDYYPEHPQHFGPPPQNTQGEPQYPSPPPTVANGPPPMYHGFNGPPTTPSGPPPTRSGFSLATLMRESGSRMASLLRLPSRMFSFRAPSSSPPSFGQHGPPNFPPYQGPPPAMYSNAPRYQEGPPQGGYFGTPYSQGVPEGQYSTLYATNAHPPMFPMPNYGRRVGPQPEGFVPIIHAPATAEYHTYTPGPESHPHQARNQHLGSPSSQEPHERQPFFSSGPAHPPLGHPSSYDQQNHQHVPIPDGYGHPDGFQYSHTESGPVMSMGMTSYDEPPVMEEGPHSSAGYRPYSSSPSSSSIGGDEGHLEQESRTVGQFGKEISEEEYNNYLKNPLEAERRSMNSRLATSISTQIQRPEIPSGGRSSSRNYNPITEKIVRSSYIVSSSHENDKPHVETPTEHKSVGKKMKRRVKVFRSSTTPSPSPPNPSTTSPLKKH